MKPNLAAPCPYNDLHIYYLSGRAGRLRLDARTGFIGNWEEEDDSFLFFTCPADDFVEQLVRARPDLRLCDRFRMTYEQWHGGNLKPIQVGRLCVAPPWIPDDRTDCAGCTGIVLDPGVVFGTGAHPTTHDCLSAIQLAFESQPVSRVIDLGTGTGLLALAAARLGAGRVLAVDLNLLAVQTAYRNVLANHLVEAILVVQGDAINFMDSACDLVVSNIHYAVMRQLVCHPAFMRRQRQFVLSGLLRSQARELEALLLQQPAEILNRWDQDGIWHTLYGRSRLLSRD